MVGSDARPKQIRPPARRIVKGTIGLHVAGPLCVAQRGMPPDTQIVQINGQPPILSVYLEAGPVRDQKFHESLLTDLAKRQNGEAEGPLERTVQRELRRIRSYLELYPADGQPLAIFSGLEAGIFEVHRLPETVTTQMWIEDHRHDEPLLTLLKRHPRTVIVAADKERARIFVEALGEIHLVQEVTGEPIRRHRQGGIHRAPYQRRIDIHSDRNLHAVAEWLDHYIDGSHPAIYLAGPPEAMSSLREQLSPKLQRAVLGELHVPLYMKTPQLAEELRGKLSELER